MVVTLSYDLATHQVSTKGSEAGCRARPEEGQGLLGRAGPARVAGERRARRGQPRAARLATALVPRRWSRRGRRGGDRWFGGRPHLRPRRASCDIAAAHPELKGYLALRLSDKVARQAGDILRGQVAVAMYDNNGALLDATGVQTAYVLDSLYAGKASTRVYGATFGGDAPAYRLWAPTAQQVSLLTWPAGAAADAPVAEATRTRMERAGDGSWTGQAGERNARYLYEVTVFAPSTGKVETNLVTDPYSVALTLNSTRSVAVDLRDRAFQPEPVARHAVAEAGAGVDSTIYELHVRDFSVGDQTVSAENRGSYLAFAEDGDGTKHLKALADAGLNTVHLLPTFDIASIEEDPAQQATPQCDLESYAPDSEQQQACVNEVRGKDAFNWGYDPWHFNAPEGSYASTAAKADGGARVAEFRTMVGGLHRDGLRVVLDQVFNHTAASGQDAKSVLDKVVPGYYHRLNATGAVETSTCCQNIATEHQMAQKADGRLGRAVGRDYKVDGFRFDLMGHHSRENMLAVRAALDALTPAKDGVDGKAVYLYGEGWNFGEVANNARFTQATQGPALGGTGIGSFSDRLRDACAGRAFDEDPRKQGFGSGEATDPNGAPINDERSGLAEARHRPRAARPGRQPALVRLPQQRVRGGPARRPAEVRRRARGVRRPARRGRHLRRRPRQRDAVRQPGVQAAPGHIDGRPRADELPVAGDHGAVADAVVLARGRRPAALEVVGPQQLRQRRLVQHPRLDRQGQRLRPRPAAGGRQQGQVALHEAAPREACAQAHCRRRAGGDRQAQDLLRLRFSSPLFRLGTAEAVNTKVSFPASGTADAHEGVIAMRIDDTRGADVDPSLKGLVVVFNAPEAVTQKVPGLAGASLVLSTVQAQGSDPVVRTATWDAATGSAAVPARTVAVFVQP